MKYIVILTDIENSCDEYSNELHFEFETYQQVLEFINIVNTASNYNCTISKLKMEV